MSSIQKKIFTTILIAFVLNQTIERMGLYLPFFHSYFDDLLCFPIVLTIVVLAHRNLRLNSKDYVLPISHIVLAVLLFSLIFEIVLPRLHTRFTHDARDILAYTIGAFFFHKYLNVFHEA